MAPHFVNSFCQIGISDPFPDDDQFIEGSLDDVDPEVYQMPSTPSELVYDNSRYLKGLGPYCVYIPRKELMLKIMRACISVTDECDLWLSGGVLAGHERLTQHLLHTVADLYKAKAA